MQMPGIKDLVMDKWNAFKQLMQNFPGKYPKS